MERSELELCAELAALRLKDGDIERLGEGVDRMLSYFELMSKAPVAGLEPTTHAHLIANRHRPDTAATDANPETALSMLEQAADLEGRLIVIPNVL